MPATRLAMMRLVPIDSLSRLISAESPNSMSQVSRYQRRLRPGGGNCSVLAEVKDMMTTATTGARRKISTPTVVAPMSRCSTGPLPGWGILATHPCLAHRAPRPAHEQRLGREGERDEHHRGRGPHGPIEHRAHLILDQHRHGGDPEAAEQQWDDEGSGVEAEDEDESGEKPGRCQRQDDMGIDPPAWRA